MRRGANVLINTSFAPLRNIPDTALVPVFTCILPLAVLCGNDLMASILIKSFGVWLLILLAAIGNGVFRDLVMTPKLGDPVARAISCFTLSLLIVLITWVFITRLGIFRQKPVMVCGLVLARAYPCLRVPLRALCRRQIVDGSPRGLQYRGRQALGPGARDNLISTSIGRAIEKDRMRRREARPSAKLSRTML